MTDDARTLTADYEQWLGDHIPLDPAELATKHDQMRHHAYRFLRGTYYLWLDTLATEMPDVLATAPVAAVGDLHVENFGTWRDHDQVRRWGINDLDELATGPWLPDLLRLAVSASVAPHVALSTDHICRVLLDAYAAAEPGPSLDLTSEAAAHVRDLVPEFADPVKFYTDLAAGPPTHVPDAVARAATGVAEAGWHPSWHRHEAGTGSLGHVRAVGVGPAGDGKQHAREAKQLGPGTAVWARLRHPGLSCLPQPAGGLYAQVRRAIVGPDAAARVDDWHIRDLAPDVVRIQVTGQDKSNAEQLLVAMAQATANAHGTDASQGQAARSEAKQLDHSGFRRRVEHLAERTQADYESYRATTA